MNRNDTDKEKLLQQIRQYDFALYETALYLDGHPRNKRALRFYEECRNTLEALRASYREKYGPLTLYDNVNGNQWQWVDTPWPWEKESN